MRRIAFTQAARRDLAAIESYISKFDPEAAGRLVDALAAATASLAIFSERHPAFRDRDGRNRRAMIVRGYLVIYTVFPDQVRIMRVIHHRRQRSKRR